MTMTQCTLTKGTATQTSWIPTKVAKVGNTVKLKENGEWDEGWLIESAGSVLPEDAVKERSQSLRRGNNFRSTK